MGGGVEHGSGSGSGVGAAGGGRLALSSEFATVHVWVDTTGNGPRLTVEDQHNGNRIHLDPLELASLTWLRHADLGPFLDPSRTGWRDSTPDAVPDAVSDGTSGEAADPGEADPDAAVQAGGGQR